MDDKTVQYIVVRESLNMSIGKTAAQACHATQLMVEEYYRCHKIVKTTPWYGAHIPDKVKDTCYAYHCWLNDDYAKIVLRADEKQWAKLLELPDVIVITDNGLTEVPPDTQTVLTFVPVKKSGAPKLIKRLRLL